MNDLIRAYQNLFPNRHSVQSLESRSQLEKSIQIELLDELTHPRVRKSPEQKLVIAFDRIENSELDFLLKKQLKELYEYVYVSVNSK